jgi:hypothetical protein
VNDYLTKLVARSLDRVPSIHPRVPSLFESPAPLDAPEFTETHPADNVVTPVARKQGERVPSSPLQMPVFPDQAGMVMQMRTPSLTLPVSQESLDQVMSTAKTKFIAERGASSAVTRPAHTPIMPALEPPTSQSFKPIGASPPPAIRVTIGRIDVRAILPPAQPARQATTPNRPRLSLNEYLKQRDGRGS